jgi:hypothetical protein
MANIDTLFNSLKLAFERTYTIENVEIPYELDEYLDAAECMKPEHEFIN